MRSAPVAICALVLAQGCVIGGEKYPRARDLPPNSLVERPRILGIQADPPEVRPGSTVNFSALIGSPPEESAELGVVWLACPVDDEGNGFGCVTDFGAIDLENPDPEALAELGFIGFEPGLPPVYVPPTDLLSGMTAEERREGSYVLVQVTALPLDTIEQPVDEVDFGEILSAYKRLIVSEAETPNHNPGRGALLVDGSLVPAESEVVYVEPEQTYEIGMVLVEDAIESYQYVTREGEIEDRVEELYVSWYTTSGEMLEEVTLWPTLDASWVAPKEPGTTGTWYAVLRDRRGGMSWYVQNFVVGAP